MTSPAHVAQQIYQLPSSAFDEPALVNPGSSAGSRRESPDDGLPIRGSVELMAALQEIDEALPGYLEAEQYYDGDPDNLFASPKIRALLAKNGINDVDDVNYAAVPVDAVVEKLQIRAVTVSAGEEASDDGERSLPKTAALRVISATGKPRPDAAEDGKKLAADRAQEALDEIRRRNQLEAEEGELFHKLVKYGDAYLFAWPVSEKYDDENEPAGESAEQIAPEGKVVGVDVFVNSPLTTRAFYDPENPLRMTHVIKTWEWLDPDGKGAPTRRATLTYHDRIERWVCGEGEDPTNPEAWRPYIEEGRGEWPSPNPVGRLPFWHFRNGRPFGTPEHKPAYGPQQLINKLISAHAATIDYQSFPQRYALSNPKADEVLGNLIDPDFPEDDDDDPEGEGHSQLRADPSAVWKLPGMTSVGQFAAADPAVFMTPLDRYVRSIAETTGTPLHRFTGYSSPPSGASLQVSNEPLDDKVKSYKRDSGNLLQDVYETCLGWLDFTDITVSVKWEPTRAATGLEDWNVIEKKIAMGVPVKIALMEAGYPEDEVEGWLSDETGADLMRRVALLNQLGTAVQTLGAGVALGIVSAKQVGDIISRFLGLTAEQLPALEEAVELQPVDAAAKMALEQQQRTQQMAEHSAGVPPAPNFDPSGKPIPPPPDRPLPPPPQAPPPVQVGN